MDSNSENKEGEKKSLESTVQSSPPTQPVAPSVSQHDLRVIEVAKALCEPKKKEEKKEEYIQMDYDEFAKLKKNHYYFTTASPLELIETAPKLREVIYQALSKKPYGEQELLDHLEKKDPLFPQAFTYIMDQVEFDGENFESCRRALELISEGIEVRVKEEDEDTCYFGLQDKLDKV